MNQQGVKESDKEYYPPETLHVNYCASVLAVVLKYHPRAKELFDNVKDCVSLPGVRDTFDKLEQKMPDGKNLIKGMVTKAGYNIKSKPEENTAIAGRRLLQGAFRLIESLKNRLYLYVVISSKRRHDLNALARSVDNFIWTCFNSDSAKAKGNFRITGKNSKILAMLIFTRAVYDTNPKFRKTIKRLERFPVHRYGKKVFSLDKVLEWKMPALAKRSLISQYIDAGFKFKHGKVIETTAWRWYQCRVVNDGPTGYYEKQLKKACKEDPVVTEPENLLHELTGFDEALGYAREKTGKRKT